jgi:cyclic dehypoxanthinyl futalosine synthase
MMIAESPITRACSQVHDLIVHIITIVQQADIMSVVDRSSSEFRAYLELYQRAPLLELGQLADAQRRRRHPDPVVTYIIDRNINYTNVCVADCQFCAFYRRPRDGQGYVLSFEEIGAKIDECKEIGGVQILLQGGHNPYIPFEWYLDLMRYIKRNHPIHIHGFSPSEVVFFSERFRLAVPDVVRELREAGLDSIPGGGGEILVDRIRERVAKKKAQTEEWLGVQEEAHRQGMKTSVTMMYGLGETDEDRVEHLLRVRELQQRTGGFTAFICWPLQPEGTPGMSDYPKTDAVTYLRTLALSRVVLENVPNLQSSWVTMGHKVGQIALRFGANDYGSLMMEENVVSAAGTTYRTTLGEIDRIIRDAGFRPMRRRQDYSVIEEAVAA